MPAITVNQSVPRACGAGHNSQSESVPLAALAPVESKNEPVAFDVGEDWAFFKSLAAQGGVGAIAVSCRPAVLLVKAVNQSVPHWSGGTGQSIRACRVGLRCWPYQSIRATVTLAL